MSDGDPAQGADQLSHLHVEDVDEAPLEGPALQEHLATVPQTLGAVHDHVDLRVGARPPHIACHHLDVVHDRCSGDREWDRQGWGGSKVIFSHIRDRV